MAEDGIRCWHSEPILDTLYWHYCEDVGIETAESKAACANFNEALEFLSVEKINEIYLLAITLSAESERAAFICGVKLGVQFALEIGTLGNVSND